MLARPASSDSGAPESLVAGLREARAAASPAWRGFSGFADSIAATCAEFGGAPADASFATMAVSSSAAITARILTDFRLGGRKADDARNATAEWPFPELRTALRRRLSHEQRSGKGPSRCSPPLPDELKTATERHGFREIPTTSRWASFHPSRAARDRRSRDHILANSQA